MTKPKAVALLETIGMNVQSLRREKNLNTTALAEKVGISQAQVSRLENALQGFRTATLAKIALALGVPAFRLLMTDEEWARYERSK